MEGWHVQRMRLAHVAVAATMTPAVIACDATEGVGGVTVHRAGSATTDPTGSSGRSQAEPTDEWLGRGLFSVEADQAEYWRMLTLDRFDGASWTRSHPDDEGVLLAVPAALPQHGGSSPPRSEMLNQTFRILGDTNILTALPMAQAAEEIAGPLGHITWDTERSQALPQGRIQPGMEYTVRSRIAVPTSEELDQVEWVPDAYEQWTELPAGLDPRITAIAEQWTTHSSSNYQKVLAIQQHFHDGSFAYSTDVAPGIDLVEFLTETKTGYCEQTRPPLRSWSGPGSAATHRHRVLPRDSPGGRQLPGPGRGRPQLGRGVLPGVRLAPVRTRARHGASERETRHIPEPGGDIAITVTQPGVVRHRYRLDLATAR